MPLWFISGSASTCYSSIPGQHSSSADHARLFQVKFLPGRPTGVRCPRGASQRASIPPTYRLRNWEKPKVGTGNTPFTQRRTYVDLEAWVLEPCLSNYFDFDRALPSCQLLRSRRGSHSIILSSTEQPPVQRHRNAKRSLVCLQLPAVVVPTHHHH